MEHSAGKLLVFQPIHIQPVFYKDLKTIEYGSCLILLKYSVCLCICADIATNIATTIAYSIK